MTSDWPVHVLDYNPEFSQAVLLAVLVKLDGAIELTPEDLEQDAYGDSTNRLYRLALDPLDGGKAFRLSVVPSADDDSGP
ncbi:hypothetical protein [Amycolatopsis sp. cmx-4-61]|uniref:hypothetical protein n=1 Tax=Amycolatopsis sp. cmx-4-61 TaxID=2790937 RepID=UPI003978912D